LLVNKNIIFINILDGDTCFLHMDKFNYLKNKYNNKNIFIGDMKLFQLYWNNIIYLKKNII